MREALLAAIVVGGVGANVAPKPPLVPKSLWAVGFALTGVWGVTMRDARGDAARCVAGRAAARVGRAASYPFSLSRGRYAGQSNAAKRDDAASPTPQRVSKTDAR